MLIALKYVYVKFNMSHVKKFNMSHVNLYVKFYTSH